MGACQNQLSTATNEEKYRITDGQTTSSFQLLTSYKNLQRKETKLPIIQDLKISKSLFVTTLDQKFQDNYRIGAFLGSGNHCKKQLITVSKVNFMQEAMEKLISGGELFEELIRRRRFEEKDSAQIMSKIFSAISYCHENNVIHRDLKPENILIDYISNNEIDVKVIDFGASVFHDPKKLHTEKFGTVYYVAPEVLAGRYDYKCDVWSLGVILYVLLCGEAPFGGKNDNEILAKIKIGNLEFKQQIWTQRSSMSKDIIRMLLNFDKDHRVNCTQALEHPWIKQKIHLELSKTHLDTTFSNLQKFTQNKLQEAALTYIVFQLTSQEEQESLIKSFKKFDKNGNGTISKEEMIQGYQEMYGFHMSQFEIEYEVDMIWNRIDLDGNGKIDFTEWEVATINKKDALTHRKLKKAFDMFDLDRNGTISALELKQVMGSFVGDLISDKVWQDMINEVDKNGNGLIDFEEFQSLMSIFLVNGGQSRQ
ncbi:protein kinase domain containing protein [Stylonychia lemnae]|uniref:Protein kinase domain containing protein n=1 Tax=Stylonychia lemnae TaxID=5949 RepID=A0A078AQ37_STYLE|nr:protein kinase domain containing protein [Stylonychia lemnae]|eukprot:CDW84490.1 protein kinase domain containing protein [Stylonychia lemnae]